MKIQAKPHLNDVSACPAWKNVVEWWPSSRSLARAKTNIDAVHVEDRIGEFIDQQKRNVAALDSMGAEVLPKALGILRATRTELRNVDRWYGVWEAEAKGVPKTPAGNLVRQEVARAWESVLESVRPKSPVNRHCIPEFLLSSSTE